MDCAPWMDRRAARSNANEARALLDGSDAILAANGDDSAAKYGEVWLLVVEDDGDRLLETVPG